MIIATGPSKNNIDRDYPARSKLDSWPANT